MNPAENMCTLLEGMPGVRAARVLNGPLRERVRRSEASNVSASGGLRLDNRGMEACLGMEHVFIIHCDSTFPRPEVITMRMVDTEGTLIGHDVPPSMRCEFEGRDDLLSVANGFVIYAERMNNLPVTLEMLESPLVVPGAPEGTECLIFFPSLPTAELLNMELGLEGERMATVVVGARFPK